MIAPLGTLRLVAVTILLALTAWLGIEGGFEVVRNATTGLQRFSTFVQVVYGTAAGVALWSLLARRSWLRSALLIWLVAISITGALAPVAWGGASWSAGALGGAATAAVAGLVVWAALAQARDGRHPAPR